MADLADTLSSQDCNLIADAFERGVAHDSTEASVFAPLSRTVQNTKSFASGAQKVLAGYQPNISATEGLKLQNQTVTLSSEKLSKAVKDCIPCLGRIVSSVDLNVGSNLIDSLKADVSRRLNVLNKISDLLSNVDIYGDYCQLVGFLNSMCVPDLQRMLSILASLITDFGGGLISLNGLLQTLISPFFTPILMSMQSLLDQFVQLVLSPINCIITSIQLNIKKLDIGNSGLSGNLDVAKQTIRKESNDIQGQIRSGMTELGSMLEQGNTLIRNKLDFYFKQLDKVLKSFGENSLSTISISSRKLVVIRLIGLIQAIIKVQNQGINICDKQNKPRISELDNFFGTFISPTSPFVISVDPDGGLRIEEKPRGGSTAPPGSFSPQPKKLLETNLFAPVSTVLKCKFATTAEDADKVNNWISQLNGV